VHAGICAINPKYRSRNQEDAPELFRYFIDGLIEGELAVLKKKGLLTKEPGVTYKKKESATEQVLCTYQAHRVTCLHCPYISWTFHLSLDLNIDIDKESVRQSRYNLADEKKDAKKILDKQDAELKTRVQKDHFELTEGVWNKKEDKIPNFNLDKDELFAPIANLGFSEDNQAEDLEDLLDNFFRREVLNNVENYYTCYGCNKARGEPKKGEVRFITKTFFLYDPSPVIVITLKRFKKQQSTSSYYSVFSGSGSFTKIDTQVKFPPKLSLTKYFMSSLLSRRKERPRREVRLLALRYRRALRRHGRRPLHRLHQAQNRRRGPLVLRQRQLRPRDHRKRRAQSAGLHAVLSASLAS